MLMSLSYIDTAFGDSLHPQKSTCSGLIVWGETLYSTLNLKILYSRILAFPHPFFMYSMTEMLQSHNSIYNFKLNH